jgi:hypothetical protein
MHEPSSAFFELGPQGAPIKQFPLLKYFPWLHTQIPKPLLYASGPQSDELDLGVWIGAGLTGAGVSTTWV